MTNEHDFHITQQTKLSETDLIPHTATKSMINAAFTLILVAVASLFVVTATNEALAFEPTEREQKIIEKLAKIRATMEKRGEDHPTYEKLQEREAKRISQLNGLGVYLEDQKPSLDHLTEQYQSTRQAALAGIEPIEEESPEGASARSCDCEKTMYVKAGYKDPYTWFGITFYNYFAGVPSADISSGSTGASFVPHWTGLNQGIVPYCYTSSVTQPAYASYDVGLTMRSSDGNTLIPYVSWNDEVSYFIWYHTHDRFDGPVQNNLQSGPRISCAIGVDSIN